jgi:hypothetical protein
MTSLTSDELQKDIWYNHPPISRITVLSKVQDDCYFHALIQENAAQKSPDTGEACTPQP